METALDFVYWSLIAAAVCFMYYIAVMELHKYFGKTWWVKAIAGVFLVGVDAPLNIIVVSVWFLELPKEWLVTSRLKRWRLEFENSNYLNLNWMEQRRLRFAVYICDQHLDKYDSVTGDHC